MREDERGEKRMRENERMKEGMSFIDFVGFLLG
jgi:hypothetical protein